MSDSKERYKKQLDLQTSLTKKAWDRAENAWENARGVAERGCDELREKYDDAQREIVEREREVEAVRAEAAEAIGQERDRAETAERQLANIACQPDVYKRRGVGDGSTHDAVVAVIGALDRAERERDAYNDSLKKQSMLLHELQGERDDLQRQLDQIGSMLTGKTWSDDSGGILMAVEELMMDLAEAKK